jgi:hypothetical protein
MTACTKISTPSRDCEWETILVRQVQQGQEQGQELTRHEQQCIGYASGSTGQRRVRAPSWTNVRYSESPNPTLDSAMSRPCPPLLSAEVEQNTFASRALAAVFL